MSEVEISRVGRLWLNAYYTSFDQYVTSHFSDVGSYCTAAIQLKFLLERCPEQGKLVRKLALSQMNAYQAMAPRAAMLLLGETAARASRVSALPLDLQANVIRELFLGTLQFRNRNHFAALDHINNCLSYLKIIVMTPFGRWVSAREAMCRGEVLEALFEYETAIKHYRRAHNIARSLLANNNELEAILPIWNELLTPPRFDSINENDFRRMKTKVSLDMKIVVLNSMQYATVIASFAERAELVRLVRDDLENIGGTLHIDPIQLIPAIGALSKDERIAFTDLLRVTMERKTVETLRSITGEDFPENLFAKSGFSHLISPSQEDLQIVNLTAKMAKIESHIVVGELDQAQEAMYKEIEQIGNLPLPMLYFHGQRLRFLSGSGKEEEEGAYQIFLAILGGVISEHPGTLLNPGNRLILEPAIEAATAYALDQFASSLSESAALSALLDLQRSPLIETFPRLVNFPETQQDICEQGTQILADSLSRIRHALAEREDVVALITHKHNSGIIFICCESGDAVPEIIEASEAYIDAMNQLSQAIEESKIAAEAGMPDELEDYGIKAFNALPKDLRAAILRHKKLLIAPDYSADHDTLPFELMHTGRNFLMIDFVISRFSSLRHLASSLDTQILTPNKHRALILGISEAKGYPPLPMADTERRDVLSILNYAGYEYDAPAIATDRLSSRFITDRLSFIDVLHFAAHGESVAGTERLILPDGTWLEALDLEQHPQASMPFVYINTCELGQTRYLGGGRGRGLAYTFSELGAPAVLAYTDKVLDEVSAALAASFYRHALAANVGDALRHARKELLANYSASLVSKLVLLGNPEYVLPSAKNPQLPMDSANDLLDLYFDLDASRYQRSEALTKAMLEGKKVGPRLEAAARLIFGREEAMHANAGKDLIRLQHAVTLAEAIKHRRTIALLKYVFAKLSKEANKPNALELLREALRDIAGLARIDTRWEAHHNILTQWIRIIELENRGIDIDRIQRSTGEKPDFLKSFVASVIGTEELWESRITKLRDEEKTIEDITWNAVLMGYGDRFSDIPEKVTFCRAFVAKLVEHGELQPSAQNFAVPILLAVLSRIWSDNLENHSLAEFVAAQVKTILTMVEEIRTAWSLPEKEPWYLLVNQVPEALDSALEKIDSAGYNVLNSEMDLITALIAKILGQIASEHPKRLDSSRAYIAGCFATMNPYKPWEGDSYTGDRLTEMFNDLTTLLDDLILKGYDSLPTQKDDELIRWRKEGV